MAEQTEREKLIGLCVEIFAHCELDCEITLGGNGTNCSEAANVAEAMLNILKVKYSTLKKQVAARAQELMIEYGIEND